MTRTATVPGGDQHEQRASPARRQQYQLHHQHRGLHHDRLHLTMTIHTSDDPHRLPSLDDSSDSQPCYLHLCLPRLAPASRLPWHRIDLDSPDHADHLDSQAFERHPRLRARRHTGPPPDDDHQPATGRASPSRGSDGRTLHRTHPTTTFCHRGTATKTTKSPP